MKDAADTEETAQVLAEADLLYTSDQISAAVERMAAVVSERLAGTNPLILSVMVGGLLPTAQLISRLSFPLDIDYVHATRYRNDVRGSKLHWIAKPSTALEGRTVLVVDDILDEGITLAAILDWLRAEDTAAVYSAALVHKDHDRKPAIKRADFTGLTVPDRYVFGAGMDYKGRLRQVSGIYAVKGL